jgi:3-mercaptopyruvate sulfurtransferase SseA
MLPRRSFLLAAAGALAALACTHSPKLKELTVDEVAAKIAANDASMAIYDCNGRERFDQGHLPGARWVVYDSVTAADLPANKGTLLVFYCASEL